MKERKRAEKEKAKKEGRKIKTGEGGKEKREEGGLGRNERERKRKQGYFNTVYTEVELKSSRMYFFIDRW